MTSSDPSRLIAALARDQVDFDLKAVDVCFLAGLHPRADRAALASFEEDMLVDLFKVGKEPGRGSGSQRGTSEDR